MTPNSMLNYDLVTKLCVSFIHTEVTRTGFHKVVLGLSGGIDSAVVAALAVRALGAENCLGIMMPHQSSSPASEADARIVATALSLPIERVDISPVVDGYLTPEHSPLRRGNFFARTRMAVLFDWAAREQALVIGTSNKTELLLGYSTWFGDGAWSLCPIGDLYKHQIVELAMFLDLPSIVWEKPPTADLWDGQTDETELGFSYDQADEYLKQRVDQRKSIDEICAGGFPLEIAKRIERRIQTSHFKRVPPPIAKLHPRSVGNDFLYARDFGT